METFAKRMLMVIAAISVLIYVGYHIFMATYTPVKTETAEMYDEYETIDTKGFVLRSESLISTENDGFVYYIAENGSRVSKGGNIALMYSDAQSAADQQRIKELDEEIERLESIQEQGQNSRTNLDLITKQLKATQSEVIFETNAPSFYELDELSDELLTIMNKQQITIGAEVDFTDYLGQLNIERETLKQKDIQPTGTVKSPIAGYFVGSVDGFEAPVNPDEVITMTVSDVKDAMAKPPVENNSYIGKVVGSYEWYLVCIVQADELKHLPMDSTVRLRLPLVSGETIPVTLVAQNRDRNGEVAVVFRCDYMSADLSDIRKEDVQILVKQHSGLRVPDEAVRFNDVQEPGVFVKEGNMIVFRRIRVLHHSDHGGFSICEVIDDKAYLQLYDDIVMEGKKLYDGKIVKGG